MSLLYDGFMKIRSFLHGGKTFECIVQKDSALTILTEKNANPLEDIITFGKQFRVGPAVRNGAKEVFSLCGGYVEDGEDPFVAASRESAEEFGALGFTDYLGSFSVAPGTTTEVSHVCVMDVKEWVEPTDLTEGITPVKMKLGELLDLIEKPHDIMSARFVLAILLYAQHRGVYGRK